MAVLGEGGLMRKRVQWSRSPGIARQSFYGSVPGLETHSATVYFSLIYPERWIARVDEHAEGAVSRGNPTEHRTEALAKAAAAKRLRAALAGS